MSKLIPKYTTWDAINTALALAARAIDEVRNIARTPGPAGQDGIGFDDFSVEHDGERGFTFKFTKGDRVKEFPFKIPVVLDRGVYKSDTTYERGDAVTYGGQYWICQDENKAAPGLPASGWRLSVKKGRDARERVAKVDGPIKVTI